MSVTFGAVGDIISVCLLVKDLVELLDNSRGSPGEYRSLVRELYALERSLLHIDILCKTYGDSSEIGDICIAAQGAVKECQQSLEELCSRIQKYDVSFQKDGSGNVIKDAAMKLRWHISEKEAVVKFRDTISSHTNALNILLASANVKLGSAVTSKLDDLKGSIEADIKAQGEILSDLQDGQRMQFSLIFSWKSTLKAILRSFGNLQKTCMEMSISVRQLLASNSALLRSVQAIESGLPSALERTLFQQPFILEDAIGRIAPIPHQLIESWEAFEKILELRFRGIQGADKVLHREYVFQDHAMGSEIVRSRPWQGAFLPGQRVYMSFVFERTAPQEFEDESSQEHETSCPSCGHPAAGGTTMAIDCYNCGMRYRRITEIQEVDDPTSSSGDAAPSTTASPECGSSQPSTDNHTRKRRLEDTDADLSQFKKVWLITKRIKTRSQLTFPTASRSSEHRTDQAKTASPRFRPILLRANGNSQPEVLESAPGREGTQEPQDVVMTSTGEDPFKAGDQPMPPILGHHVEVSIPVPSLGPTPEEMDCDNDNWSTEQFSNLDCEYFVFENGRRYHAFKAGRYHFPNDEVELEREDMLHHLVVELVCEKKLHFAPLENPSNIVDVGTGTGIWAIDMGDEYPEATVTGIDLSPIQPPYVPPNVSFMLDDAEDLWLYPGNSLDFVHLRHMGGAIQDWPKLMSHIYESLKPGGWIEIQDMRWQYNCEDGTMDSEYGPLKMMELVERALEAMNIEFAPAQKHIARLTDAGFANIGQLERKVPVGRWPKAQVLKTMGHFCREIVIRGLDAVMLGPLTRGLGWSKDEVEQFAWSVRRDLMNSSIHSYVYFQACWAQKPLDVAA